MRDPALERFEQLFGPEFGHGKPFDLARLKRALGALGNPQDRLAPVIHVAGTNGKGSTIAFMRAIAEVAGLKVHAFTKPHLFRLSERFCVAGETASDEALIAAAERVAAIDAGLTQFDAQVAAALLLFTETPADVVLLETGMGGRDDSTNVIDKPALSVITPVSLDHGDALGGTLAAVAAHKAGILKPGVTAVLARQPKEAQSVIEARARELAAPLLRQGVEWDAFISAGRLVVQTHTRVLDLPPPALLGAHQVENAGLAAVAMFSWGDFEDSAFSAGMRWTRWPARLEPLTRGGFSAQVRAAGGEVWVDGGHNEHAAHALSRALRDMQARRGGANIAIVGLRARKDAAGFVAALSYSVERIIAAPLGEAHVAPDEIVRLAREAGVQGETSPSLAAAMHSAAQSPAPRVLICGSFLLAAEALAAESD